MGGFLMDIEPPKSNPKAWGEYFAKKLEAQRIAEAAAETAEEPLEIIEPSRPARYDDLGTSLKGLLARLAVAGFWSAAQVTVVKQVGTEFKTGDKAGEMRPDKEITNVFIHAAHPDMRCMVVWYRDGGLNSARVGISSPSKILEKVKDLENWVEGMS